MRAEVLDRATRARAFVGVGKWWKEACRCAFSSVCSRAAPAWGRSCCCSSRRALPHRMAAVRPSPEPTPSWSAPEPSSMRRCRFPPRPCWRASWRRARCKGTRRCCWRREPLRISARGLPCGGSLWKMSSRPRPRGRRPRFSSRARTPGSTAQAGPPSTTVRTCGRSMGRPRQPRAWSLPGCRATWPGGPRRRRNSRWPSANTRSWRRGCGCPGSTYWPRRRTAPCSRWPTRSCRPAGCPPTPRCSRSRAWHSGSRKGSAASHWRAAQAREFEPRSPPGTWGRASWRSETPPRPGRPSRTRSRRDRTRRGRAPRSSPCRAPGGRSALSAARTAGPAGTPAPPNICPRRSNSRRRTSGPPSRRRSRERTWRWATRAGRPRRWDHGSMTPPRRRAPARRSGCWPTASTPRSAARTRPRGPRRRPRGAGERSRPVRPT